MFDLNVLDCNNKIELKVWLKNVMTHKFDLRHMTLSLATR